MNFHLDYELKGPKADGPDANTDPDRYAQGGDQDALLPYMGTVLIPELASHQFCLDSDADGPLPASCDEVYNDNEFKKNPGVAGIAVTGLTVEDGGPIEGLVLELRDPDGFLVGQGRTGDLGMDTTDEDGWYQVVYKH